GVPPAIVAAGHRSGRRPLRGGRDARAPRGRVKHTLRTDSGRFPQKWGSSRPRAAEPAGMPEL
ncbi:MAG: hypothetical protein L0387_39415, partial [Acidobacteria bacterium]|nr:hypothetical protein [Acidobacteriota bacterium]